MEEIKGIGHRVLHGGEIYSDSVIIDDKVLNDIVDMTNLGPLHHPGEIDGIKAMMEALPKAKQVAVFDTAFHQTMPAISYIYAIPYEWYTKYKVRKYGFHGTSHKYITGLMQEILDKKDVNIISCHIGSGSSIAAIKEGKCYDTTMGLTPLDGLMMGTRSGSIDPSILGYVCKEANMSIEEVTRALNKESGCLAICGVSDNRDIEVKMNEGSEMATLGFEMFCDRIAKYIVDYYIELEGKVDAIVFTAGVGENGILARSEVLKRLKPIGITVNEEANGNIASYKENNSGIISGDDSSIKVYVEPTNEELMIALDTMKFVS